MSTLKKHKFSAVAQNVKVTDNELIVTLEDARVISVPLVYYSKLQNASLKERNNWELICRGTGIHWKKLDEDISVAHLLGLSTD